MPRLLLIAALTLLAARSPADPPPDVGSHRELFVDRLLVDSLSGGATQRLHEPQPAGTALTFDSPWDGIWSGYVTVMKTADEYRMYYRGNPGGAGTQGDGNDRETTCFARSDDGVHWTKPSLGLFEVAGTKDNNVVLAHRRPFSHNFAPFEDTRPGVPASERFKAIAGIEPDGLAAFVSADGVHWSRLGDRPVFTQKGWSFDSQNVALWSQAEQRYVLYYRRVVKKVRTVARATSEDFRHWSEPVLMEYSNDPPTAAAQLYTNQTTPYFRAPQICVGLAARWMQGRSALPKAAADAVGVAPKAWLRDDCSDTVLLTTRGGGNVFDRTFPQGFIRPGPDPLDWGSRGNYAARGVVQTGPAEMSVYVQRHYGMKGHRLERLALRLDGFASIHADAAEGEMVTRAFTFGGSTLALNYSTSAAGSVRVELRDADNRPIPGFTSEDCIELVGDTIEQAVSWKAGTDVSQLAGRPVRVRFILRDADVYSFRFQ